MTVCLTVISLGSHLSRERYDSHYSEALNKYAPTTFFYLFKTRSDSGESIKLLPLPYKRPRGA